MQGGNVRVENSNEDGRTTESVYNTSAYICRSRILVYCSSLILDVHKERTLFCKPIKTKKKKRLGRLI